MAPLADLSEEPSVHTGNCVFQRNVGSAAQRAQRGEGVQSSGVPSMWRFKNLSKIHLTVVQIRISLASEAGIKVEKFISRVYVC